MSKNFILNCFLISVILGIFINNIFENYILSILILFLSGLIFINFNIYEKHIKKYYFLYVFLFIGYIFGILISSYKYDYINKNDEFIQSYLLSNYNFTFRVEDLYKKGDNYDLYIVKLDKINGFNIDKNILGLVYIKPNFILEKGDLFSTNSRISIIDNIDNTFNYKYFLYSKNIYFKSYLFDIKNKERVINFSSKIYDFKKDLLFIINKIYPREEAFLLSGILLGERSNFSKDLIREFNNSGTTHIIAVSGFNITILIIFLGSLFGFFPLFIRSILIIFGIILFSFLVGFEASVLRASLVGLLGYFVHISGRNSSSITILLLACFIMLLFNPLYLNFDVSFQLSFLAVLGILFTSNYINTKLYFMTNIMSIKESFVLTISASLFTLPIILFNFGQLPLLTPLSNLLFIWTIPFIMLFGFLSIIFAYINSFLSIIIGFIPFLLLKWDISIVHFFGNLDKFIIKLNFGFYNVYFQTLYYIFLIFLILYKKA